MTIFVSMARSSPPTQVPNYTYTRINSVQQSRINCSPNWGESEAHTKLPSRSQAAGMILCQVRTKISQRNPISESQLKRRVIQYLGGLFATSFVRDSLLASFKFSNMPLLANTCRSKHSRAINPLLRTGAFSLLL